MPDARNLLELCAQMVPQGPLRLTTPLLVLVRSGFVFPALARLKPGLGMDRYCRRFLQVFSENPILTNSCTEADHLLAAAARIAFSRHSPVPSGFAPCSFQFIRRIS